MTTLPPWTLPQFEQYVEIAVETMAKEGVVRADVSGKPIWRPHEIGQLDDGSLRVKVTVDLSAIGLPVAMPMAASTQANGAVTWSLGGVPVVTIPDGWTPEEAGEAIGRNQVLAAYRQWAGRNGGPDRRR